MSSHRRWKGLLIEDVKGSSHRRNERGLLIEDVQEGIRLFNVFINGLMKSLIDVLPYFLANYF